MMKFWRRIAFLMFTVLSPFVSGSGISNPDTAGEGVPGDYWPQDGWRRSAPEEQGMDSAKLFKMLDYLKKEHTDIHSLLIIRNGYLVTESYFYPYQKDFKHVVKSCTKSVTSALIGIAIGEGRIKNVDENVLPYFGDLKIAALDARKEALTLKHLLTMTTGLDWTEDGTYGGSWDSWSRMWQSNNQIQFILDRPMRGEPGRNFYYCTGASHLLSAILQRGTGKSLFDYAQEKLFGPMGIKDVFWQSDLNGVTVGGSDLYLTPADMAKFGYLYLKKGKWNGRQLIPEQWIAVSTQKQVDTPLGLAGRYGYGYQWWMNGFGGYSARGYGGQYIFVLPQYEMVVVFTSGLPGNEFFLPESIVESFIIPAVQPVAVIKPNPKSERDLADIVKAIGQEPAPKPLPSQLPVIAGRISGKTFIMDDSSTLSFRFGDDQECRAQISAKGKKYEIPIGLDGVFRIADLGGLGRFPDNNRGAFRGGWADEKTFVITYKTLEGINELQLSYTFDGDKVKSTVYSKIEGYIIQEGKGIMQ